MRGVTPEAASLLVDARALGASGIGRYLSEILARLLANPPFGRIALLGSAPQLEAFVESHPSPARVEVMLHAGRTYSMRSQMSWARLRLAGKASADVAFFPHWDAPLILPCQRSVVTVHDLIHFRVPDAFPPLRRMVARAVLHRVVSGATRIIVDSEWTRGDLLGDEPGTADRVRVVPLGVGSEFHAPTLAVRPAHPVREPFLLCVGTKKRHKNLAAAVEILARLRQRHPDLQLVVAGEAAAGWDDVLGRAAALDVRAAVVDLPVVPDAELRALYGRCAVFLFPSRYEGFGLPVLEAMACGAPVVASNASSIPEVAGGAALLFAPDDSAGMADAAHLLLTDPELRARMSRLGAERASRFRWEETARQTAQVLQEAAAA